MDYMKCPEPVQKVPHKLIKSTFDRMNPSFFSNVDKYVWLLLLVNTDIFKFVVCTHYAPILT